MSVSLETLGIDRMTVNERLALIQAIWDSIATSSERPLLSDALRAELDQRLADHLANPNDVVSWEEVKTAAQARMKR